MNHFPDRSVAKISRGGIISAEWLNALVRAATESGNESGLSIPAARIRSLMRGDVISADFLNRIAGALEKRFRETRNTKIGDSYYFRSADRRNFGRREFRRLRRGDVITAEWLNMLVGAANELNGVHVRDSYFYFERPKARTAETTHPWKVTAYLDGDVWKLHVNGACNFVASVTGTNVGSFPAMSLLQFSRLSVPADSDRFYVYISGGLARRAFANTPLWPLTRSNLEPWRVRGVILGSSVAVAAGDVPDDFDGLLIATGSVMKNDGGAVAGIEIKQILKSDISVGFSCEGAIDTWQA